MEESEVEKSSDDRIDVETWESQRYFDGWIRKEMGKVRPRLEYFQQKIQEMGFREGKENDGIESNGC